MAKAKITFQEAIKMLDDEELKKLSTFIDRNVNDQIREELHKNYIRKSRLKSDKIDKIKIVKGEEVLFEYNNCDTVFKFLDDKEMVLVELIDRTTKKGSMKNGENKNK